VSRHAFSLSIVCLLLVVGGSVPQAQDNVRRAGGIRRTRSAIAGRYLVKLRGGDDPEAVGFESAAIHRGRLRHAYRHALRGFAIELTEAAAHALASDPRVEYVEEDGVTTGDALSVRTPVVSYGLDRIDQRVLPLDGSYRYGNTGAGVNVYVVDSGIRVTHQTFQGRAFGAYTAVYDGIPPNVDCAGHGTHVAGIVGGYDLGVAGGVTLYSVKALGCENQGSWAGYIDALEWVVANHHKPAVINASIGGGYTSAAAEAIDRAVAAGITFVGAAGNNNADACLSIPGGASSSITVGNATESDERASDSNFGKCVALFAPGAGIQSAYNGDDSSTVSKWGTSMAAPHVAGAAALYLQNHPAATPAEVRAALLAAATPGVLANMDAAGSNLLLFSPPLSDRVAPTVSIVSPAAGAVVAGTVTVRATIADDVELVDVRFSVDGTTLGLLSSPPFAMAWDTTRAADMSHTLTVEARDRGGNVTRRSVAATVANGGSLKEGWVAGSIGSATDAGQATYAAGGFTIDAAGTDVYGAADGFYFSHRQWTGDGDLVARVASLTRPTGAQFAIAGLMFRESAASDSRHASVILSTDGKVRFRRRTASGGMTASDGLSSGTAFAPAWLKLSRRGNTFSASLSVDGLAWKSVYTSTTIPMPATVEVGVLALRSGGSGLARATFDTIGLGRVPAGWTVADVGAVAGVGTTKASQDAFALEGTGTDLWSTADAFHLAYKPWTGDGEMIAMVDRLTAPIGANFALAAITMRESLNAASRHASLAVTTDGKAKFRRRMSVGGMTASDGLSTGSIRLPRWVRLARRGQQFTAFISTDGVEWQRVSTTQTVVMPSTIYVGVLGLRNGATGIANVHFSHVDVRPLVPADSVTP
jgi:regulation of enolase protein 1 (concanavalin A-like superfamily)